MSLNTSALTEIASPDPGNLRYGLFQAANGPMPFPDAHARGFGMRYDMLGCGVARPYEIVCAPVASKIFDPNVAERDVLPFMTYASINCGAVGYDADYLAEKARRRLIANEQTQVESVFWSGLVGQAPSLTGGAVVNLGPSANIVVGVAKLEAYAAANYGYVPTIHAQTQAYPWAADTHLIERVPPRLRTPLGSTWSFGGGYAGTGPAGVAPAAGATWIYITGQTWLWRAMDNDPGANVRDGIFVSPPMDTMDRALNQFNILAEREWAVSYDCFVAATEVTLAVP